MLKVLDSFERGIVKYRRKRLAREIFRQYNGTVQRGTFAGMKMSGEANVSQGAHGLKIFGLYETPVVETLASWCPTRLMVNLGAGDGYYPVGMLHAGLVQQCICFEATESGRQAIRYNSELNGLRSKVEVRGLADAGAIRKLADDHRNALSDAVVLCDIEGNEFSLFDDQVLDLLFQARIVVELHETGRRAARFQQLLEKFRQRFNVAVITDQARQWEGIGELESLHGIDLALVTSEARQGLGEWLVATPHGQPQPLPAHLLRQAG